MAVPVGAVLMTAIRLAVRSAAMKARLKGVSMGARYQSGMYGGYIRRGGTMGSAAFGKRGLTMAGQHGPHVVMGHLSKSTLGVMGGAISGYGWSRTRRGNRRKNRRPYNYNRRSRR